MTPVIPFSVAQNSTKPTFSPTSASPSAQPAAQEVAIQSSKVVELRNLLYTVKTPKDRSEAERRLRHEARLLRALLMRTANRARVLAFKARKARAGSALEPEAPAPTSVPDSAELSLGEIDQLLVDSEAFEAELALEAGNAAPIPADDTFISEGFSSPVVEETPFYKNPLFIGGVVVVGALFLMRKS